MIRLLQSGPDKTTTWEMPTSLGFALATDQGGSFKNEDNPFPISFPTNFLGMGAAGEYAYNNIDNVILTVNAGGFTAEQRNLSGIHRWIAVGY